MENPIPVKRRIGKAHAFDDYHRQQLLKGPDSGLFAGEGYLALIRVGSFERASPEQQAVVLEAMRADWARFGGEMMGRWRRSEREPIRRPWVFPRLGGPDTLPWAAEAFGVPAAEPASSVGPGGG